VLWLTVQLGRRGCTGTGARDPHRAASPLPAGGSDRAAPACVAVQLRRGHWLLPCVYFALFASTCGMFARVHGSDPGFLPKGTAGERASRAEQTRRRRSSDVSVTSDKECAGLELREVGLASGGGESGAYPPPRGDSGAEAPPNTHAASPEVRVALARFEVGLASFEDGQLLQRCVSGGRGRE
jgi:hypothetical protein